MGSASGGILGEWMSQGIRVIATMRARASTGRAVCRRRRRGRFSGTRWDVFLMMRRGPFGASRCGWNRSAFGGGTGRSARPFPQDGGRFRRERAFFGVVMPAGGMRQLEGSSPETLRRDLEVLCVSFNRCVDAFSDSATPELMDCTRAAGALYACILRVHPFADGNHRTSFVALSSALWSFGLPNVRFVDDAEMIAHDDAVTGALLSDAGDVEPFARLLAERIEGGRKDPT